MATQTQTELAEEQYPLAAQIPVSSFTLPVFPAEASRLRALTLTSDINLNDYQQKHLAPGRFEPSTTIPSSITHLTLELFSLGFPGPFLRTLAERLPNLQSLTLFSCLIDGIDDRSRHDAVTFFKSIASGLRELHVVDTFARVGFWKEVSGFFPGDGLKILEVSYTYRGHHESDFLNRTAGEEWMDFITPGLVGLTLNFASPSAEDELGMQAEKGEDQENLKAGDGILPYASDGRASQAIVRRLKEINKAELKVLDITMFAVSVEDLCDIAATLSKNVEGLIGLSASVLMDDGWFEQMIRGLHDGNAGKSLESLEITGVPASSNQSLSMEDAEKLKIKDEAKLGRLTAVCPILNRFDTTILKSRTIGGAVWQKKEKWALSNNSE